MPCGEAQGTVAENQRYDLWVIDETISMAELLSTIKREPRWNRCTK